MTKTLIRVILLITFSSIHVSLLSCKDKVPTDISSIKVYYIPCNIDYDSWVNNDKLKLEMRLISKVCNLSKENTIKVISDLLNERPFVKHKLFSRLDVRVLIEVELKDKSVKEVSFDSEGNILFDNVVYSPINKVTNILCAEIKDLGCFCYK